MFISHLSKGASSWCKKIRLAGGATGARHLVQCHGAVEQLSRGAESWLGEPHARGDDATEAEKITVS